jgi:hypothetical protein
LNPNRFRQFRLGGAGPGAGIGCGGLLAVIGLVLVSPVGEWLIKSIGWILIVMGALIILAGIYYLIRGPKRGGHL